MNQQTVTMALLGIATSVAAMVIYNQFIAPRLQTNKPAPSSNTNTNTSPNNLLPQWMQDWLGAQ